MSIRLKDQPLAVQIWIILGLVLGISFALIILLFPVAVRKSFTRETYERIDDSQQYVMEIGGDKFFASPFASINEKGDSNYTFPPLRVVRHIFITRDGEIQQGSGQNITPEMREEIIKSIRDQEEERDHYLKETDEMSIMYTARKTIIEGEEGFLVSYLRSNYRENLVKITLHRLIITLIFVMIISWIASIFIARYLTRPLIKLKEKVKEIAEDKRDNPVEMERKDEIGKLGETVEWMRKQLLEQDEKQRSFLQQVSHDLKTPVMVIRSYARSIQDGIFPRGELENSLQVIEEETCQLEKRVRTLLNITKYDYLSTHRTKFENIDLAALIEKEVGVFSWRNSDIDWELDLKSIWIRGDRDKLTAALDNILDNQIRYAAAEVKVKLWCSERGFHLLIANDGPPIDEDVMEVLFQKFQKGSEGEYGLGLAIAKKVVELHDGKIEAENTAEGVNFYLDFPGHLIINGN